MAKVGIILNSIPYGGGAFQYSETILDGLNYMKSENPDIEIVVAYDNMLWKKYLDKYAFKKIKVNLQIDRAYFNNLSAVEIRDILPKVHSGAKKMLNENCDVWLCPSQDLWSFVLKAPMISTIHDLMHRYESRFPEVSSNDEFKIREYLLSNACKYSKRILVDSTCGKEQVRESYEVDSNNIKVLPYVPPKYIFEHDNNIDTNKKYNLNCRYIFYPAQFWEHKNHINLIKAISRVKETVPNVLLVLSGSVKYSGYGYVLQQVKKLKLSDNVKILGYVPEEDIPSLYKNAEMMVMPTFFGPTNIPPLEAMALKCPMAVSNIYGMPEQIGSASLYFNPNEPIEIAECIKTIWENKSVRQRLVENCSKEICRHSNEDFYIKLCEFIKDVINIDV